jgi:hypothetical protein
MSRWIFFARRHALVDQLPVAGYRLAVTGQRVVAGDQDAAVTVVEDRVARRVTGSVEHMKRAVAQRESVAIAERARDVHAGSPAPERTRHRLQGRNHVRRDPVPHHQVARELVVGIGLARVVLDERDGGIDRGDLGAGARRHDGHQSEVVDVLMGEDHQHCNLRRRRHRGPDAADPQLRA